MSPRSRSSRSLVGSGEPVHAESDRRASRSSPTKSKARVIRIFSSLSWLVENFWSSVSTDSSSSLRTRPNRRWRRSVAAIVAPWSRSRTASKRAATSDGDVPVRRGPGPRVRPRCSGRARPGRACGAAGSGRARAGETGSLATRSQRSLAASGRPALGHEVEPGPGQEELRHRVLGAGLADAFGQELVGGGERLGDAAEVGVDQLAVEPVAVQGGDGEPRVEPSGRAGGDGRPEPAGSIAVRRRGAPRSARRAASGPRRWSDRRGSRGPAARGRRHRRRTSAAGCCSARARPRARARSIPARGRIGPAAGSSATRDSAASASVELAGLEEVGPRTEPVSGRRRGLAGRRGEVRGASRRGGGLRQLAGPLVGVSQRVPGVRRLPRRPARRPTAPAPAAPAAIPTPCSP